MNVTDSAVDAALERAVETGAVPGAVAAVTDRTGTLHQSACGVVRTGEAAPLRVDHVFRIASMSKLVTSIAVLMLHDEGRVDLDAPFADYVPGYVEPEVLDAFDAATGRYRTRPARSAITVRRLLTHTSGYGYWFLDSRLLAVQGPAPDLFNAPFLVHEPGERFAYGTSTDMLGLLMEPVTGVPLDRFFAERIFAPLGMHDTGFDLPAAADRLVPVHFRAPGGGFGVEPNETAGVAPRGGGGLVCTAHDFLCLLRMLLNDGRYGEGRLLSAESARALTTNQIGGLFAEPQTTAYPERTNDFQFMDGTQKFGLGVLVETEDRTGRRRAGSYSWGGIVNTYFWADAASGIAGVLMAQLKPFCDAACIELLDAFERAVYAETVPGGAAARRT